MTYTKDFKTLASVVVTECLVFPAVEIVAGKKIPHCLVREAIWDTGADTTIISSCIAKELGLKPISTTGIQGVNGLSMSNLYRVHIGLPSGELVHDVEVMEMDDEACDYGVIIGMDLIHECDLAITHPNNQTKFTYERPSKRDLDFTKE